MNVYPDRHSARTLRAPWRAFLLVLSCLCPLVAQLGAQVAPSHDPSRIVRNTDGRYWIFTTGDGIWTMSSSNPDFTDWRPEAPVFPIGTWPGWINNYVTGFNGAFWAPDVIQMNGLYYCYYSCAGQGAPAAIGVATAQNLNGPWTDRGLVVAGNNAIDPAPIIDGGSVWLSYGNWQSGIDLIQINPSNGLRQGSSRWDLIPGEVEGPYLLKNGSYYYLFFQRGLCCNGLNSSYHVHVGRSTSITGPYVDRNGVALTNGGGTVFLPNRVGRFHGPGHIGYGEGRLTYHFYDVNDNGAAKLRVTTLGWSNGWPVVAGSTPTPTAGVADGTWRLRNRATGRYLDNLGSTADGATVAQWAGSTSNNQRWVVSTSSGYRKLRCVTGGKYLDTLGNTADGSSIGQWASSPSYNQQWTFEDAGDGYFRIVNRANGKSLDTGGNNANGTVMQSWFVNTSPNQQWQFVAP